jgi:hypothetical protein
MDLIIVQVIIVVKIVLAQVLMGAVLDVHIVLIVGVNKNFYI